MSKSSEFAPNRPGSPLDHSRSDMDLTFPDWSGQPVRPSRQSVDEMLRYCESALASARNTPGYRKLRRCTACPEEFRL
jgi:hypothetical protein